MLLEVMRLVMKDASFGQSGICSLLTMLTLGNGGIEMPNEAQTGVRKMA